MKEKLKFTPENARLIALTLGVMGYEGHGNELLHHKANYEGKCEAIRGWFYNTPIDMVEAHNKLRGLFIEYHNALIEYRKAFQHYTGLLSVKEAKEVTNA